MSITYIKAKKTFPKRFMKSKKKAKRDLIENIIELIYKVSLRRTRK